jgi:hypothetical protein
MVSRWRTVQSRCSTPKWAASEANAMCCDRRWSLPNASMSSALVRLAFVTILARLGLRSASDPRPVRLCARASRACAMGTCTPAGEHVQDTPIMPPQHSGIPPNFRLRQFAIVPRRAEILMRGAEAGAARRSPERSWRPPTPCA